MNGSQMPGKESNTFIELREFILSRMRMSHIYQPVMLKTMIERQGAATIREIAAEFLARDESQLEYYDQIVKAMPGRVLSNQIFPFYLPVWNLISGKGGGPFVRREAEPQGGGGSA